MAGALIEAGADVAITGRERFRAEAVAAEFGGVGIELDVRDERSVQVGVDEAYERLGGVDMLVNNAGIGMRSVNPRFLSDRLDTWLAQR